MTFHERVYRSLLRAYPGSFRHEYADLMTQLFADQVRDARSAGGRAALLSLWLRSVVDVAGSAVSHRIRKGRTLTNSYYPLMAGLLGITLIGLMFTGPAIAIPVFVLGIIGLAAWQRRRGLNLRPSVRRPLTVLLGVALIVVPTVLFASPLTDEEGWSSLRYGIVWTAWAIAAVSGLAFVAVGLVQVASSDSTRSASRHQQ
jgi:hypothetical protein